MFARLRHDDFEEEIGEIRTRSGRYDPQSCRNLLRDLAVHDCLLPLQDDSLTYDSCNGKNIFMVESIRQENEKWPAKSPSVRGTFQLPTGKYLPATFHFDPTERAIFEAVFSHKR